MHASHNRDILAAAVRHLFQEFIVGGQILHMGGGIVDEAILPGQVDTAVRFPEFFIDIIFCMKDRLPADRRPGIQIIQTQVTGSDIISVVKKCFGNKTANIAIGSGDGNFLFHIHSSLGLKIHPEMQPGRAVILAFSYPMNISRFFISARDSSYFKSLCSWVFTQSVNSFIPCSKAVCGANPRSFSARAMSAVLWAMSPIRKFPVIFNSEQLL